MTTIKFRTPEQKGKEDAHARMIEQIEKILEEAREGKIVSIGLAYVTSSDTIGNGYFGWTDGSLGYCISLLDQRFKNNTLEALYGDCGEEL